MKPTKQKHIGNSGVVGGAGSNARAIRAAPGFIIWSKGPKGPEAAWCEVAIQVNNNHEHWRGRILQCSPVTKKHAGLPLGDLVALYPLTVAYDPSA